MHRSFSQFRSALSLLATITSAVLPSCGGNSSSSSANQGTPSLDEKSLFPIGVLAVDSPECVSKADADATVLGQGVLDLAFTSSYTARLLVGNQLARPGSAGETERVSLSGVEVTLTTADGAVLDSYSTVGTGFVDAASASVAYGAITATLIPPSVGLSDPVQHAQQLVAKVRVLGEALNGTKLTSSELVFPIKVCTGCLVEYPPSAADVTSPPGSGYLCSTARSSLDTPDPEPCVLGQDVAFSCQACAASVALCRDPSLNPAISP